MPREMRSEDPEDIRDLKFEIRNPRGAISAVTQASRLTRLPGILPGRCSGYSL
jgi:hypothetical protein